MGRQGQTIGRQEEKACHKEKRVGREHARMSPNSDGSIKGRKKPGGGTLSPAGPASTDYSLNARAVSSAPLESPHNLAPRGTSSPSEQAAPSLESIV